MKQESIQTCKELLETYPNVITDWETCADPFYRAAARTIREVAGYV